LSVERFFRWREALVADATSTRGGAVTRKNEDIQRDDKDAAHAPEKAKKDLDRELDKALMDSFPASDPPATSQPTGTEPAGDPKVKP
jgi:hypothetical protein